MGYYENAAMQLGLLHHVPLNFSKPTHNTQIRYISGFALQNSGEINEVGLSVLPLTYPYFKPCYHPLSTLVVSGQGGWFLVLCHCDHLVPWY